MDLVQPNRLFRYRSAVRFDLQPQRQRGYITPHPADLFTCTIMILCRSNTFLEAIDSYIFRSRSRYIIFDGTDLKINLDCKLDLSALLVAHHHPD